MSQAPDWLIEEERLERLAKGQVLGRSDSVVLQTKRQLRTAFDVTVALVVIFFLGLLCWNWNGPSPAADRSGQVEYKNAFYRALDEGSPFPGRPRTVYPPGFVMGTNLPKSRLDPLLLPANGSSLQAWLEAKDLSNFRLVNNLKVIELSPPDPIRKKKKVWTPVRDLYGEVPRGIE